ncbi:MAG: hypothetical protein KIT83_04435 [Bryobacterales bacterium]|nr:hypothetical protein [Bryobacterales bacterium]
MRSNGSFRIARASAETLPGASARTGDITKTKAHRGQRGGALVEAALVSAFLYVPLLLGLVVVGLSTIARLQLDQLVRDVGIMHARGVDFGAPSGYDLFVKLTQGSVFRAGGSPPSYNGTVVISTVRYVSSLDCASCSNLNQPVVTYRVVLGDSNLFSSRFGDPGGVDSDGRVTNWRNDPSSRAPAILAMIQGMQPGDEAFVAEGYMKTPGISFPSVNATSEVQSWAIF